MPQFQSSVVVAVHITPLIASAIHAVMLTCAKGNGSIFACGHGASSHSPKHANHQHHRS